LLGRVYGPRGQDALKGLLGRVLTLTLTLTTCQSWRDQWPVGHISAAMYTRIVVNTTVSHRDHGKQNVEVQGLEYRKCGFLSDFMRIPPMLLW